MKQHFETFTAVYYRHTFFPARGYEGISVSIPALTAKHLLNNGLLVKPLRDGFVILCNRAAAGNGRSREVLLQDGTPLSFDLLLNDRLFYNYTQINNRMLAERLFLFSNAQAHGEAWLHRDAYVTEQDLSPLSGLPERRLVKPFGRITLQPAPDLQRSYEIRFRARQTRWCYFLMGSDLKGLSHPAVIDTNGNEYFDGPEKVFLPGRGEADVFISRRPIPLSQTAPAAFQLVDYLAEDAGRYRVVIPALPAPEPERISGASAALHSGEDDYSEIFLY